MYIQDNKIPTICGVKIESFLKIILSPFFLFDRIIEQKEDKQAIKEINGSIIQYLNYQERKKNI